MTLSLGPLKGPLTAGLRPLTRSLLLGCPAMHAAAYGAIAMQRYIMCTYAGALPYRVTGPVLLLPANTKRHATMH